MKYIYSTSQMSKLSLTLCTFSITGSVAGLFLTISIVSYLADLIFLPLPGFILNLTVANRGDRFILVYPIAISFDTHMILFIAYA